MKFLKTLALVALCAGLGFAQEGYKGGLDGLHQQSAYTLGKSGYFFGASTYATFDKWAFSADGTYTVYDENGDVRKRHIPKYAPSFDMNLYAGMGLSYFMDVGFTMPFYYDHINQREAGNGELWAGGVGDLELWTKFSIPWLEKNTFLAVAMQAGLTLPTGTNDAGMRLRHAWYANGNDDGRPSHAFTSGDPSGFVNVIATVDLTELSLPFRINGSMGYTVSGGIGQGTIVWVLGGDYLLNEQWTLFLELSGESRFQEEDRPRMTFDQDPIFLTPGFRYQVNKTFDVVFGIDIGAKAFVNPLRDYDAEMDQNHNLKVLYESESGDTKIHAPSVNNPYYGGRLAVTWRFGGDKNPPVECCDCDNDMDKDLVPDSVDQCLNSPRGIPVDSVGCPFDEDKDNVPDFMDSCKQTRPGVTVDSIGCPLDEDKDSVPDVWDKCPQTPEGVPVDSVGCPFDEDKDNVYDYRDSCLGTKMGLLVDFYGCPSDKDKDGVQDFDDWCPNTPEGWPVDSIGCTPDTDKDGVHDFRDQCPGTPYGDQVDSVGCSLKLVKELNLIKKGIFFQTASFKLQKRSYKVLDELAGLMKEYPYVNLEIQGHTDSRGGHDYNVELSKNRAKSAVDYLITKKSVDSTRLRAEGYGPDKPIADNNTAKGRQMNRRVELVPFTENSLRDTVTIRRDMPSLDSMAVYERRGFKAVPQDTSAVPQDTATVAPAPTEQPAKPAEPAKDAAPEAAPAEGAKQ